MFSPLPLVLIPAFNASATIHELLVRIANLPLRLPVVVIDDGSTDETASIAGSFSCQIIRHPRNKGKGEAIRSGLRHASQNGFHAVITIDADLQHPPELLPKFLAVADADAVVIGRRSFFNSPMPWPRRASNLLTSLLISIRTGTPVHDSQCGFRRIPVEAALQFPMSSTDFTYESELLLRLLNADHRLVEIEIPTIYGQQASAVRPWRDTWRFASLLVKSLFW